MEFTFCFCFQSNKLRNYWSAKEHEAFLLRESIQQGKWIFSEGMGVRAGEGNGWKARERRIIVVQSLHNFPSGKGLIWKSLWSQRSCNSHFDLQTHVYFMFTLHGIMHNSPTPKISWASLLGVTLFLCPSKQVSYITLTQSSSAYAH